MAAYGETLMKRIRAQASCTACIDFYSDPVLLRCGASFCRACVEELSPAVCPHCDAAFEPGRLAPNHNLARLVELARVLLEQEEKREAEARGPAGEDRDETVFCKQEKALICPCCYVPEEHQGHDVLMADLAAKEYKTHLQKCQVRLKRDEKDIMLNKSTLEVDCEYYVTQLTFAWEKTRTAFQQMEEFLEMQKRLLLAQMTEVCKEIKMNKNEQLCTLTKKLCFLQDIGYKMEEASQLPGSELLENIGDILQTFEERETVQPRGSLSFDMQNKISSLVNFHMFLMGSMKYFRENVVSGLNRHRGITTPNSRRSAVTPEDPQPVSSLNEAQLSNPGISSLQSE